MLIWKSGRTSCRFYRFYLLWNWPSIYVCQESIMSQPRPLSVHQKHLKGMKSWERGWVIRFLFDYPRLIETSTKNTGFFWVPNILKEIIIGESFLDRIVLLMNKHEWNENMVGMYGAIYGFFTILLMYIYRNETKVQVEIVLKTSLEHILSTMILILINLPRYFFLILVYLLMPVRKCLSVKLRFI